MHTADAAEAERRLQHRLRELADGRGRRPVGDPAPVETPLADAVARWLLAPHGYTSRTLQSARNRLAAWLEWCASRGVTLASQITPALVDAWITERSAAVSRRTVNRDLRAARVALRWCSKRKLLAAPAALGEHQGLREPARHLRREVPDPDELARVLEAVTHPRHRAALYALAATGLRIEELRRLHLGSLVDGRLRVEPQQGAADTAEPGKGYRSRDVPLAPAAVEAVRRYLGCAWSGPRKTPPSERSLLTALHRACDAVKVPRCGLHDLRRAFATEAFRAGVPLTVIALWLGHADVRTTEGYVVAYRSDRGHTAPVPRALGGGADKVQSPGVNSAPRGSTSRVLRLR
jgi:integrase/recombinase XerD